MIDRKLKRNVRSEAQTRVLVYVYSQLVPFCLTSRVLRDMAGNHHGGVGGRMLHVARALPGRAVFPGVVFFRWKLN